MTATFGIKVLRKMLAEVKVPFTSRDFAMHRNIAQDLVALKRTGEIKQVGWQRTAQNLPIKEYVVVELRNGRIPQKPKPKKYGPNNPLAAWSDVWPQLFAVPQFVRQGRMTHFLVDD
jgi:hypothetical protein